MARWRKLSTRLAPHWRTVRMSSGLMLALASMPRQAAGGVGRRQAMRRFGAAVSREGCWRIAAGAVHCCRRSQNSISSTNNQAGRKHARPARPPRTVLEQAPGGGQHGVGLGAPPLLHHLQQPPPHARLAGVVGAQAPGVACLLGSSMGQGGERGALCNSVGPEGRTPAMGGAAAMSGMASQSKQPPGAAKTALCGSQQRACVDGPRHLSRNLHLLGRGRRLAAQEVGRRACRARGAACC